MPDLESGASKSRGRLMIDAVIQIVIGKLVSDPGKMNDDITEFEQRLPVDRPGQIRERNSNRVLSLECGHRP